MASQKFLFILAYLTVVSVPTENHNIYEPFMPALMKASLNITVHYRSSICTITAVQTTVTYVIEATYSWNTAKCGGIAVHTLRLTIYSQYSQPKLVHWQHLK
jgi:predicted benzoate:H+ symporter BenE